MYYLFILFALFSQFNSLLKFTWLANGSISGLPFGWVFAFLAIFVYFLGTKKKIYTIDVQTLSFSLMFLMVIFWAPWSIGAYLSEYLVRFLQFFSAFSVYIYCRNYFFLNFSKEKIITYFLILQLPSILFGLTEILYIITDNSYISNILMNIREITTGRSDVILMKTVVFHFFEHSMSVSYVLMLFSVLSIWLTLKNQDLKSVSWFKTLREGFSFSWFSLFLISTLLFMLFHRSGTYVVILAGVLFFGILSGSIKNKIFVIISAIFILYVIGISSGIFAKFQGLLSGQLMSNDFYRFSSVISSLGTLLNYPFGSGAGSFSSEYFIGIVYFLDFFNLDAMKELTFMNSDIMAKQGLNPARATSQTLYLGLISELGILFILLLLVFHKNIFIMRFSLIKLAEVAIILNLCLGYPMAYPQLWVALGLLHGSIKK
jgi:hypothetical protein